LRVPRPFWQHHSYSPGACGVTIKDKIITPSEEIDALIAKYPDWRGARLAELRRLILDVDPGIDEEWKWMGSPVWERGGILCVGNIFKNKVKLIFMYGASLDDPDTLFNAELEGNQRRAIDFFEADVTNEDALKALIQRAIEFAGTKRKK
jgi:hypothetical protein